MKNNLIGTLEHCHGFDIAHRPLEWVTSTHHVIMLVTSGSGTLNWKEHPDQPRQVDSDRHCFHYLPPDSVRFVDVRKPSPMHLIALRFTLTYEDGGEFSDCYRISESLLARRQETFREALPELLRLNGRNDRSGELEIQRRFHILIGCFLEAAEQLPSNEFKMHLGHCRPAVIHLRHNCEQLLDVDHLAKLCNVSRSYFFSLFRRETGMTAQQYQRRERLIRARKLLLFTRKSVAEIGEEVGWSDPFHFSRIFTRETGYSPTKYRRMMIT